MSPQRLGVIIRALALKVADGIPSPGRQGGGPARIAAGAGPLRPKKGAGFRERQEKGARRGHRRQPDRVVRGTEIPDFAVERPVRELRERRIRALTGAAGAPALTLQFSDTALRTFFVHRGIPGANALANSDRQTQPVLFASVMAARSFFGNGRQADKWDGTGI